MYVYTYISIMCVYMYVINIIQTVVTTAFCRFLRKKLRPRATSFPSLSLPSYFRLKKSRPSRCHRDRSVLFLSSFSSRTKIAGRRTRVIGQGSKTWKGYRNSLFPPFLSSFLSFVAISFLLFPLRSYSVSFSFSSPLSPPSEKKEIDLNVRDGR